MSDLKTSLIALMRGQGPVEDAEQALRALITSHPDKAPQLAEMLDKARKAGLETAAYETLRGTLTAAGADPGATVILPTSPRITGENPDLTVVIPDPTTALDDAAAVDSDPFIETVVLPAGRAAQQAMMNDAAVFGGHGPDTTPAYAAAPDSDATVLAPVGPGADPDATVLAPAEPDATVLAPVAPDAEPDATVLATDREPTSPGTARGPSEETTEVGDAAVDPDETAINVSGADADTTEINAGLDDDATALNVGGDDKTAVMSDDADFDVLSPESVTATETAAAQSGAGVTREFREGDRLRNRYELISKLGEGGMGAVWKGKDLLKEEARDRNPYCAIKLLQGDFKQHPESFIALQREASKQQRLAHPNIATVFDFDRDDVTNTVFMTMEVLEGTPIDVFVRKLPADGLPEEEAMPHIRQLCAGLAYAHSYGLVHSDSKPGNCFLTKEGSIKLLDFGIARASKTKGDAEGETTLFDPGSLGALTPTYATVEMFEGQDPDPRDDIYALGIMTYQLLTGKHPYGKKSAPKAKELNLKPTPVDKISKRQNRGLMHGLAFLRDDRSPSVEAFLEGIERKKSRAPLYATAAAVASIVIGVLAYNPVIGYLDTQKVEEVVAVATQPGIETLRSGLAQATALDKPELTRRVFEDERTRTALIDHMARGGEQAITEGLETMKPYDLDWQLGWQQDIKADDRVRRAIFDLFENRILLAFDVDNGLFDFARATGFIGVLDGLYPDSAQVLQLRNGIRGDRDRKLAELGDQYKTFREEGRLIPNEAEDDIGDVLAIVAQIDPEHRLLKDDQLRFAFAREAESAIASNDYARADAFLQASAAHAPDDKKLNDLRYQVRTELQRIENEKRVAEIEQRLQSQLAGLKTLRDFQGVRDDLVVLADLSPQNPVLQRIQTTLRKAFSDQLSADISRKRWGEGEQLLVDFAKLLEIPYLTEQRTRLSGAESKAGFALSMTPERRAAVTERIATVDALLAEPQFTTDWEIQLKVPYKELIALLPADDPQIDPVRERTARLYLEQADRARESGSFSEALAFVDKGRDFYPGLPRFDEAVQAIASAREAEQMRRQEEERLARIEGLKAEFQETAARDEIDGAKSVLAELQKEQLAGDDDFLSARAPQLLAEAYQRRAQALADVGEFDGALTLAKAGLALAPDLATLKSAADDYADEVAKRQLQIALGKLFDSLQPLDTAKVNRDLGQLKADFPNEYTAQRKRFADARGQRIKGLANDKSLKIPDLARRLAEYKSVFPDVSAALRADVVATVEKRIRAVPMDSAKRLEAVAQPIADFRSLSRERYAALSRDLGGTLARRVKALEKQDKFKAAEMLAAARKGFPDHGGLAGIDIELPLAEIGQGRKLMDANRLSAAEKQLATAKQKDPGHSDIAPFEQALKAAMDGALARYQQYAADIKKARPSEQKKLDSTYASIKKRWLDNEDLKKLAIWVPPKGWCSEHLAGHGAKRGGVCYDVVAGKRGPTLVVVPAGGGLGKPFAIGKGEVSVADYNLFCKATKKCKRLSRKKGKLPVTNISLADAEAYARWLSEAATKARNVKIVYRLPSKAEWEHAAGAGGKQPEKGFNCRVTSGGSVIAGHALVKTLAGAQNAWGLINYVGNAQEWVTAGGSVVARGGAFEDPLAKCELTLERAHSGSPDPLTGFRLVRELG